MDEIMDCRRIGSKPLFKPVMTLFTDAYVHHTSRMSLKLIVAQWRHVASWVWFSIDSNSGLAPIQSLAITLIKCDIVSNDP